MTDLQKSFETLGIQEEKGKFFTSLMMVSEKDSVIDAKKDQKSLVGKINELNKSLPAEARGLKSEKIFDRSTYVSVLISFDEDYPDEVEMQKTAIISLAKAINESEMTINNKQLKCATAKSWEVSDHGERGMYRD